MANVHVKHCRAVTEAGLAALLAEDGWQVTRHGESPLGLATADVVVADYDAGLRIVATYRPPRVVIVTHRDKEWEVRSAMEQAVQAYVLEDATAAQLRQAVRAAMAGSRYLCPVATLRMAGTLHQQPLTNRESDVLRLLARGHCNKLIARDLGIGVGTVKTHIRGVMTKLGATARTHAVVVAAQRGLVGIDERV